MSVAKIAELVSDSPKSFEDAINVGIARANKTLRNVSGAWVESQKAIISDGKISTYRVFLKITFVLDE